MFSPTGEKAVLLTLISVNLMMWWFLIMATIDFFS